MHINNLIYKIHFSSSSRYLTATPRFTAVGFLLYHKNCITEVCATANVEV